MTSEEVSSSVGGSSSSTSAVGAVTSAPAPSPASGTPGRYGSENKRNLAIDLLMRGKMSEEVATAFREANTIEKGKSAIQEDLRVCGKVGSPMLYLQHTRSQREKEQQNSKSNLIKSTVFLATAESTNEEVLQKMNQPCSRMELNAGSKSESNSLFGLAGMARVQFYRWTVMALFSSVPELKDVSIDHNDLRAFHFLCIAANIVRRRITAQIFQRVKEEYRKAKKLKAAQKRPSETGNPRISKRATSIRAGHNPNVRTNILGRRAAQVRLGAMCAWDTWSYTWSSS